MTVWKWFNWKRTHCQTFHLIQTRWNRCLMNGNIHGIESKYARPPPLKSSLLIFIFTWRFEWRNISPECLLNGQFQLMTCFEYFLETQSAYYCKSTSSFRLTKCCYLRWLFRLKCLASRSCTSFPSIQMDSSLFTARKIQFWPIFSVFLQTIWFIVDRLFPWSWKFNFKYLSTNHSLKMRTSTYISSGQNQIRMKNID